MTCSPFTPNSPFEEPAGLGARQAEAPSGASTFPLTLPFTLA